MKFTLIKAWRKLIKLLLSLGFLLAGLAIASHYFLPDLQTYRPQIEALATQYVHQPVTIHALHIDWKTINPTLQLKQLHIGASAPIAVDQVGIQINIGKSLWQRKWILNTLTIAGVDITVKQDAQGRFDWTELDNLLSNNSMIQSNFNQQDLIKNILNNTYNFSVKHLNINWYDIKRNKHSVRDVALKLQHSSTTQYISGHATLSQLNLATISFYTKLEGRQLDTLKASTRLQIKNLQIESWLNPLVANFYKFPVNKGTVNILLNGIWKNQHWETIGADFKMYGTVFTVNQLSSQIDYLAGHLLWHDQKDQQALDITNLELVLNNKRWPTNQLHWLRKATQQHLLLDYFDLQELHLLQNSSWLPNNINQAMNSLQLTGQLSDIRLNYKMPGTNLTDFQVDDVKANFTNVAWHQWKALPGVDSLSGSVKLKNDRGEAVISNENITMDFADLFRNTLWLKKLRAEIHWQKTSAGWQVKIPRFFLGNPDISVHGLCNLLLPVNDASPIIDLRADAQVKQVKNRSRYFPVKIMSPALVAWLDSAVLAADQIPAKLQLQGALADFPYTDPGKPGRFMVAAILHNAIINYQTHWPLLNAMNGELIFNGQNMWLIGNSAKISDMFVQSFTAVITDFKDPLLQVSAVVDADLENAQNFIQRSPLQKTMGKELARFKLSGSAPLDFRLSVPLNNDQASIHVGGKLHLQGATLNLPSWNINLKQLTGQLTFTENEFQAPDLTANLLNNPVKLSIHRTENTSYTQASLLGKVDVLNLMQQLNGLPLNKYISGDTSYRLDIQLPAAASQDVGNAILNTDLAGIEIKLPAPLGKSSNTKLPVRFKMQITDQQPAVFQLNYADKLAANGSLFIKSAKNWQLLNAQLQLGNSAIAASSQAAGLFIRGNLDQFNIAEWQQALTGNVKPTNLNSDTLQKLPNWFAGFDLWRSEWQVAGQILHQLRLQLQRVDKQWEISINSNEADGKIIVPNSQLGNWQAQFAKLYWQSPKDNNATELKPSEIPSLIFNCKDFHYNKISLGQIELQTVAKVNGVAIKLLKAVSPLFQLSAQGNWLNTISGNTRTNLYGKFASNNLTNVLQNFDLPAFITANKISVKFDINWPMAPMQFKLANADGQFHLQLLNGQITDVGKSAHLEIALGQILNLLSVQNIVQHLSLHFSDLNGKGFNFTRVDGELGLQDGNLITRNTKVTAQVADINLNGRIGLDEKDFDLLLQITPHLTASVPVAAALAGGPVVGIVAWLAEKIVSVPVNAVTMRHYRMTGSWQQPVITPINRSSTH